MVSIQRMVLCLDSVSAVNFGGKLSAVDGNEHCLTLHKIANIYFYFPFYHKACEPAGPGFYPNAAYQARGSPKLAAKNVQAIHTSTNLGTLERDSHQDWLMGNCGSDQPGAPYYVKVPLIIFSFGLVHNNHIMCPTFYVNAFDNNFPADPSPNCVSGGRDVSPVPSNYFMGYRQPNKGYVAYLYS